MALTHRKPGAKEGKPLNDAQRLASSENFAIFQLKGMLGNLSQLKRCPTIPAGSIQSVENTLTGVIKKIKHTQQQRKKELENKDG